MKSYLLSNGTTTNLVEYYIIDLFKIYLKVFPKDIPGLPALGFNFSLNGIRKVNAVSEIKAACNQLVDIISQKLGNSVDIGIEAIEFIDEQTLRLTVRANSTEETLEFEV